MSCRHSGHNGSVTSRQRPGQQGSQSQKPAVPLTKMLHEGGQTDKQHSEAIVSVLSTQHSGTLISQTSSSQTTWWWRNGVGFVKVLLRISGFFSTHTSNKCSHTCCSYTCPCNSEVNKKLQCSSCSAQ